jgi:lipid-binding SYLF domain-containing protein
MFANHKSAAAVFGLVIAGLVGISVSGCSSPGVSDEGARKAANSETSLSDKSKAALERLYADEPGAKALGDQARAILVFPNVIKAGFIIGGAHGNGTLFKGGQVAGYYGSTAGSYGLQAGAQEYGYVMFFMTERALQQLDTNQGWEVGVGPTVVVLDKGAAKQLTTTTMDKDVYAMVFGQKGLMAGLGLQGSKIYKTNP